MQEIEVASGVGVSPVVWFLIMVLLVMSVFSWGIIVLSVIRLKALRKGLVRFERVFWSGGDLTDLYERIKQKKKRHPVESIFLAGFSALLTHGGDAYSHKERMSQCRALMDVSYRKWEEGLYALVSWLATIASVSPYIGLLGTVFGVMHTFSGLFMLDQSTNALTQVAPGIAEALGMTALGLFVAIPATVAYNRLIFGFDRLQMGHQIFQDEFLVLINKQRT